MWFYSFPEGSKLPEASLLLIADIYRRRGLSRQLKLRSCRCQIHPLCNVHLSCLIWLKAYLRRLFLSWSLQRLSKFTPVSKFAVKFFRVHFCEMKWVDILLAQLCLANVCFLVMAIKGKCFLQIVSGAEKKKHCCFWYVFTSVSEILTW